MADIKEARAQPSGSEKRAGASGITLSKCRDWFKDAVEARKAWTRAALEDYRFVAGEQWNEADKVKLDEEKKVYVTINKIKPLIRVLSGYQRQNRYDIDFVPRTADDDKYAELRRGMTKYVMDATEYERHESQVFLCGSIGGLDWFDVGYRFDHELGDGEAFIERESAFNVYVDPEARRQYFADAKYIIRAKWVDKGELKEIYPEHAEVIEAQSTAYDADEDTEVAQKNELYYQRDTKKLRLCECWYKMVKRERLAILADGRRIKEEEVTPEMLLSGQVVDTVEAPVKKVRLMVFFGEVVLEHMDSPYQHGEFPLVPYVSDDYCEGAIPAGFVRDLKDPQREINKRRSQAIRVLDTSSNSGWLEEEGAMTTTQSDKLAKMGSVPGAVIKVLPGGLAKLQRVQPPNPPSAIIQGGVQAEQDLPAISGINEALMGTDIASATSGRAIELRQRQAVTHIAPAFDNLRWAKRQVAYLLWGKRGRPGIIPQFYTEEKVYRITGPNGEPQDVTVNQRQAVQDPLRGVIHVTLNDLSQGEFDIVVADVQSGTTHRIAQFWSLSDAVAKLGLPGDMVFDLLVDLSDVPKKDEIKKRFKERQQQQAQAQEKKEMMEHLRQETRFTETINFKDAPYPIQLAMAAKAKLVPQELANAVLMETIKQLAPELAMQLAQGGGQSPMLPPGAGPPDMGGQMPGASQGLPPGSQPRAAPVTKAAMQSLMAGQMPAMG